MNMQITYNSPITVDIIPAPGSIVTCRFKLKANPSSVRVDIAAHIHWRKNGPNSNDVKCSNIGKIYTENEDKIHEVNLVIPQYDITRRISLCIMLYLQGPIPYTTRAEVEDINIVTDIKTPVIKRKNINFYQTLVRQSGYGILGESIHRGFLRRQDWFINSSLKINDIGTSTSKISLILSVPPSFFKARTSEITIGYTMFETINKIPMSWIPGCNTVIEYLYQLKVILIHLNIVVL